MNHFTILGCLILLCALAGPNCIGEDRNLPDPESKPDYRSNSWVSYRSFTRSGSWKEARSSDRAWKEAFPLSETVLTLAFCKKDEPAQDGGPCVVQIHRMSRYVPHRSQRSLIPEFQETGFAEIEETCRARGRRSSVSPRAVGTFAMIQWLERSRDLRTFENSPEGLARDWRIPRIEIMGFEEIHFEDEVQSWAMFAAATTEDWFIVTVKINGEEKLAKSYLASVRALLRSLRFVV